MARNAERKGPETIIDVLESVFGDALTAERARGLTGAELEELAGAIEDHYAAWEPATTEDDWRIYPGGMAARNFMGDGRSALLTSLVYAPGVVIHDPVVEWFDKGRGRLTGLPGIPAARRNLDGRPSATVFSGEPNLLNGDGYYVAREDRIERTRDHLASVVPALAEIAPLIRGGVVLPIPELRLIQQYQEQLISAVRFDVRDGDLAQLIQSLIKQGDMLPKWPPSSGSGTTGSAPVLAAHALALRRREALLRRPV